ncbi:class I SAM-dependent methyltransferase [Plantactinospora sp. GCM10030261]|uniref:class I SAM-dependent methyltransferase n=1 Tax=Plantactinospora sp. GCM10030261 TaxID=3273420 RepID=UPI00361FD4AF
MDKPTGPTERPCDACGAAALVAFSEVGDLPIETGRHFASEARAMASPVGRVVLGRCPRCAYVRNLAFEATLVDPAAPTDMNLYHSPTFRRFCSGLIVDLVDRLPVRGARVLEVGCAQGEFLKELCAVAGCTGIGYDASYAGPEGPDPSGAELRAGPAPLDGNLPPYDVLVSRFALEHVDDPLSFLSSLRRQAGDRPVVAHVQVPDAGYDLATAGWEVIYPHVSYFNVSALCAIAERAGWRVTGTGAVFSGLIRYVELSSAPGAARETDDLGTPLDLGLDAARDAQLAALRGFDARHHRMRRHWAETISRLADEGAKPVLWGAGSRGVQLLTFADPKRRLTAVVDVNPAKWGRFLPVTGHRVDPPDSLPRDVRAVVITNPVYRAEIARSLRDLGITAEILAA